MSQNEKEARTSFDPHSVADMYSFGYEELGVFVIKDDLFRLKEVLQALEVM